METIYVKLLEEGIDVWRPVKAKKNANSQRNYYQIIKQNKDSDEVWEFQIGDVVECKLKDGHMVAVARVK